jgi:hypothetical protein
MVLLEGMGKPKRDHHCQSDDLLVYTPENSCPWQKSRDKRDKFYATLNLTIEHNKSQNITLGLHAAYIKPIL